MIEKLIIENLNERLEVPAFPETPVSPPGSYVLVIKTGSKTKNHIKTSMVAVQSIASTTFKCMELNEAVKSAMADLISLPEIIGLTLNSDYNFPNTATKQNRYQAVFDINHY